jgi:chemotaxis signal transduction protein
MAILSPLRARRSANRPVESTQQVIIFCLRQKWFALPMEVVKRVTSLNFSISKSNEPMNAAEAADIAVIAINADQKIFLNSGSVLGSHAESHEPERFLIVLQTSSQTYGLTISSAPKMLRISPSSVLPYSPAESTLEQMHCISSIVNRVDAPQTLFLLNPEQLCYDGLSHS